MKSITAQPAESRWMASKREKGKIDHAEWALITARHNDGETFASIARSYGCTAPAIRYIVNRQGRGLESQADAAPPAENGALRGRAHRVRTTPDPQARSGIDRQLREQVNSDIAAFLVAFDAAFLTNSAATRTALLEATDRLLRAGARTRLTLEQMAADDGVETQRTISTTAG
jgi:hypothetical protein